MSILPNSCYFELWNQFPSFIWKVLFSASLFFWYFSLSLTPPFICGRMRTISSYWDFLILVFIPTFFFPPVQKLVCSGLKSIPDKRIRILIVETCTQTDSLLFAMFLLQWSVSSSSADLQIQCKAFYHVCMQVYCLFQIISCSWKCLWYY